MERLQNCRVCFVKDAPMYVVVNRDMHDVYEKLTNKTFVTEDRRPVLVCYFCCSRLKQCCRFQRKCLEAEKLFTQMLDEDYELNPLINPEVLELNNGFVKSPIDLISIVGEYQIDSRAIKEEFPDDYERQVDIIETKEELLIEIEELKSENPDYSDVEDIPVFHSDSEDEVPLSEFKTEVEEEQENNWAPVAKKAKLHIMRRTEQEDVMTEEQENEQSESNFIRTTKYNTSKFKEPIINTKSRVNNTINNSSSVNNITLDINNSCNNDNNRCKISNTYNDEEERRLCVKEKRYKCDICQHAFNQKDDLTNHIRIHTNLKLYKCEVCQRSFNQKRYLTNHIRKHTNEKPNKCKVCQYSCTNNSSLIRHTRIHHTNEKPFKCEVCQNGFIQKSDLTRHIRIHTNEKPYKCEVCQYSCKQKGDLIKHNRIHTGEKPYKCELCQYSCNRNSDLRRHVRIHTGEKLYKCEECQYSSNQKAVLKNHIRRQHIRINP